MGRGPGFGVHLCVVCTTDIGSLLDQKMRVALSRHAVKAAKGAVRYMKVSWPRAGCRLRPGRLSSAGTAPLPILWVNFGPAAALTCPARLRALAFSHEISGGIFIPRQAN